MALFIGIGLSEWKAEALADHAAGRHEIPRSGRSAAVMIHWRIGCAMI
jgi:hypothetical protein